VPTYGEVERAGFPAVLIVEVGFRSLCVGRLAQKRGQECENLLSLSVRVSFHQQEFRGEVVTTAGQ